MATIKCVIPRCRGRVDEKFVAKKAGKCSKCCMRKWRAENPLRAAFANIRNHAKARGLSFTITFEYFLWLCNQTDYDQLKGNRKGCLHVDRIDATRGYDPGNLAILTLEENIAKGNRERYVPFYQEKLNERKAALVKENIAKGNRERCVPFYQEKLNERKAALVKEPVNDNEPF